MGTHSSLGHNGSGGEPRMNLHPLAFNKTRFKGRGAMSPPQHDTQQRPSSHASNTIKQ